MITDVLNRKFILDQLSDLQRQLRKDAEGRTGGGPGAEDIGLDDYKEASAQINSTLSEEQKSSSGQTKFEPTWSTRRGESAPSLDNSSFLSRDPIVSNTQSALEYYFDHPDSKDRATPDRPFSPGRRALTDVPIVSDRVLIDKNRRGPRRILDKFSITDPGWVSSLIAMGIRKFQKPHAFNPNPPPPVELKDRCRIVIVGDWGSGIPRAQKTAIAMRAYVEDSLKSGLDCQVIHLGDVYYSGWDYEYRDRFLPYWPVRPGEENKIGSWSLNGNHDMYSGGHAYFDILLNEPRFKRHTGSSFFRLYNNHWQILGLDTAWDDNGLKDPQESWVSDAVGRNTQRTMLLTHHQLFSAYEDSEDVGLVMRQKLGGVLAQGKIEAAIWGHEHRCVLYEPHANLKFARLVGHGGVPVYMNHSPADPYPKPAIYEDRRYIENSLKERWAYMGFVVLDFDGPKFTAKYVDENGRIDKVEEFS